MRSMTARERGLLGAIASLRIPQIAVVPRTLGGIEICWQNQPVAVWVSNGASFDLLLPGGNFAIESCRGYMPTIDKTIELLNAQRKRTQAA